jgi:uncharacterized alkaline shock family protein YloU
LVKIVDRLLLFIYSLIVGIISVVALCIVSRWITEKQVSAWIHDLYNSLPWFVAVLIAVCAVVLLISLRFLYLSLRRGNASAPSIDQRTDFGDIRISLETVENLALKAATRQRGVKDLRARIRIAESGIDIMLRAVVDGESSIPVLTEEIQKAVKEHIEEITGIPVSSVTVFVANVIQNQSFKSRVE